MNFRSAKTINADAASDISSPPFETGIPPQVLEFAV
jgi:hypothetical protein